MEIKKRKRGGQPGNLNALKHGFYCKQFRLEEALDLDNIDKPGLDNEIDMLRVVTQRLFFMSRKCHDMEALERILRTLGSASLKLGWLIKIQHALEGGGNDMEDALKQALAEIREERNLR